MKSHRILLGSLFLCVLVGLVGCTTVYVPEAEAPNPDLLPNLPAGTKVTLINAQPSTETILIGEAGGGRSVKGDLHAWTGQAISAIQQALQKKGVQVGDGAAKSLKITVNKADLEEAGAGWSFRCTVDFTIETGAGQVIALSANDPSWKYLNACDGAILKVALVALKDERIVQYLTNP
ncbi:MAG: hypothetical protein P4N60_21610 [Verrucomicrobiae bacterium]|nr:hypothetical protein [Verrucomicrobiae bacterium]